MTSGVVAQPRNVDMHLLVAQVVDRIWNSGKVERLGEYYTEDVIRHIPESAEAIVGLEANQQYIAAMRHAIPDLRVEMHGLVAEGDWAACRWSMHGTQRHDLPGIPASGRRLDLTGQSFLRFSGGRAAEIWDEWNLMALMQQLGA